MKVLISVDIEGVAGVWHAEQVRPGNPEYERARRLMTAEANAAIAGAYEGGASEVLVNDSHGQFRNLLPDELDPRAAVIQGKPRLLGMMAGVELGCHAAMMIGYHARAQSRGVLAHTINSAAFARVEIGGHELGEAGLYAALAGEFGVPVLLASGDDVFAAESQSLLPRTRFVVVKQAHGANSGVTVSPQQACRLIGQAASEVLRAPSRPAPLVMHGPAECRLTTLTAAHADLFAILPDVERVDAVTLEFETPNIEHAVRTLNCFSAMAQALR